MLYSQATTGPHACRVGLVLRSLSP